MRSPSVFQMFRPACAGLLVLQLGLPAAGFGQAQTDAPATSPASQEPSMQTSSEQESMQGAGMDGSGGLQQRSSVMASTAPSNKPLTMDASILLALSRFTYGPRPGDLEKVREMGIQEWFHRQLNPSLIDDSALDARLKAFPAMQLPVDKLMEMYPTNNMIRQTMNGRVGIPGGDGERAIYLDQEARYKQKKDKAKGKDDDMGVQTAEALPDSPANIIALPPDKRFRALCHLTLPQLRELRQGLSPEDRPKLVAGFTPQQMEELAAFAGPGRVVAAEDVQVKLMRDIYSERQLEEVMVDFWLNHFNVYMKKAQQSPYFISSYVRQTIRPFALSNFTQLLMATATSPAMLNYLDNSESVGPHSEYATGLGRGVRRGQQASGLNENYARELMELHTIGVNGGYTQKDVTEVAKVFTGWTVGRSYAREGGEATKAEFDATKHEPGDKFVLGHKIKSNGQGEGFEVLKMLASSPQCAKFISTKLAVRFVSDDPPQAMIDRMTGTFLETHGDIRRVLLAMVNSPEFFTEGTFRAKVKTPQDFVVSAVRAAGAEVRSTAALTEAISDLGMPLYGMQTPNGYSMKSEAWNSTTALVSRMNFALALASNRVQGVKTDFNKLLGPDEMNMTAEEKDKILEARLLHVPVSEKTNRLIVAQTTTDQQQQIAELQQVGAISPGRGGRGGGGDPLIGGGAGRLGDPSMMDTQAALAAGLIFGSPEFQRR